MSTMLEEDIEKLTKNCDKLLSAIDWPKIVPKLIAHEIYQENDITVQKWKQQQKVSMK